MQRPDITDLLRRWGTGDKEAFDQLIPAMYDQLRAVAHQRLRAAPYEASVNTTGLVHEAYLRLVESSGVAAFQDRKHFLRVASRVMRNTLVDRARANAAAKRGGGAPLAELHEELWDGDVDLEKVADLDEALRRLEEVDARRASLVEQRYFGGLSLEEIAAASDLSLATVKRDLRSARAWLALQLGDGRSG